MIPITKVFFAYVSAIAGAFILLAFLVPESNIAYVNNHLAEVLSGTFLLAAGLTFFRTRRSNVPSKKQTESRSNGLEK